MERSSRSGRIDLATFVAWALVEMRLAPSSVKLVVGVAFALTFVPQS